MRISAAAGGQFQQIRGAAVAATMRPACAEHICESAGQIKAGAMCVVLPAPSNATQKSVDGPRGERDNRGGRAQILDAGAGIMSRVPG